MSERIHLLDSVRALAIIGVIVIHVTGMVMTYRGGAVLAAAGSLDMIFAAIDLGLIIDKARACFGFLFGVSFAILITNAAQRDVNVGRFYVRRMGGLLLFGIINQSLFFFGDILISYALIGCILILFRRATDRVVLTTGLSLIASEPLVKALSAGSGWALPAFAPAASPWSSSAGAAYDGTKFFETVRQNLGYPIYRWMAETTETTLWSLGVLGLFLLGLWTARRGILVSVEQHKAFLARVAWIALPLGCLLVAAQQIGPFWIGQAGDDRLVDAALAAAGIGGPIMATGYVALCALLFGDQLGPVQRVLAPLGRISLTAYLASVAMAGPILYGYGLGFGATIGLAQLNILAIGIIAVLLAFAHVWLARYRFGPLEWAWRSMTLGAWQPMRRVVPPNSAPALP